MAHVALNGGPWLGTLARHGTFVMAHRWVPESTSETLLNHGWTGGEYMASISEVMNHWELILGRLSNNYSRIS